MAETEIKKEKKGSDEINIPVKWIVVVLALVVVVALFFVLGKPGIATGNAVSESQAEANLMRFFDTEVPGSNVQILSGSKEGSFYEIVVNMDGEQFPLYVTLDGEFLVVDMIPIG